MFTLNLIVGLKITIDSIKHTNNTNLHFVLHIFQQIHIFQKRHIQNIWREATEPSETQRAMLNKFEPNGNRRESVFNVHVQCVEYGCVCVCMYKWLQMPACANGYSYYYYYYYQMATEHMDVYACACTNTPKSI